MAAIRRRDTQFELAVRSRLHRAGWRFRVDLPIAAGTARAIRPDIVFTRGRVAIFLDGCFWHGCPEHGQRPRVRNGSYWGPKIAGNVDRDRRHTRALEAAGWHVVRIWEHEDLDAAAAQIGEAVRQQQR
jgi:DNA mismatch endonuclease, patch repair protein